MASNLPAALEPYPGISSKAYERPAHGAATAALKAVPMLETVVRRLGEFRSERALRPFYVGNSVKASERQLPELWAAHQGMVEILDMPDSDDLYVTGSAGAKARAIGSQSPVIGFDSTLLQRLGPGEPRVVIAREIGGNVTTLGSQFGDMSQQVADWLRHRSTGAGQD